MMMKAVKDMAFVNRYMGYVILHSVFPEEMVGHHALLLEA